MTQEEALKLLMIIQTSYPNHYKNFEDGFLKMSVKMWQKAFEDQPFEVVFGALSKHILKAKFPPTIAELREEVIRITNPEALKSGEEAWEEVIAAVKRFGFYRQAEAMKSFDEPTQRAVRTIGWNKICHSETIGIERSNFYKTYEALSKGDKEKALLPPSIYEGINRLANEKSLLKPPTKPEEIPQLPKGGA
jgi:hypothetical protein